VTSASLSSCLDALHATRDATVAGDGRKFPSLEQPWSNNGSITYRSMTNYVVVFDKKAKNNKVTIAFMILQLS
jgi:hypothetical protein